MMEKHQRAVTGTSRFPMEQIHQAARMYFLDDALQVEIAESLNVSRPTVSRLISEARRLGMVKIEIVDPASSDRNGVDATALEDQLTAALGLRAAYVAPSSHPSGLGTNLAKAAGRAIRAMSLRAGDVMLVSSGRTLYEVGRSALPALPAVVLAPTVGGQAEQEPWYQTNEITRTMAEQTGAVATFLFAPAMPSVAMYASLGDDPSYQQVMKAWSRAKSALVGVGAPIASRRTISSFVPVGDSSLGASVGDVCMNFFDADGEPISFPGSDRMVRTPTEILRSLHTTAVAVGREKVTSIIGASRAGLFKELVTDAATARLLIEELAGRQ